MYKFLGDVCRSYLNYTKSKGSFVLTCLFVPFSQLLLLPLTTLHQPPSMLLPYKYSGSQCLRLTGMDKSSLMKYELTMLDFKMSVM